MPSPLLRRASTAALVGVLAAALVGAVPPPPASAVADAAAARRTPIRCAGDRTSAPAASRIVRDTRLPGRSFAEREGRADGRVVRIGRTLSLRDLASHAATWDGAVVGIGSGGLVGAGIGRTTLRLAPHSSSRRREVPTAFPETNQLNVLRVVRSATVLRGFTLQGTRQGHLYNGLRVERVRGLRADHVRVLAVPGDEHQPPGETFGINDYGSVGSRWSHIRVDGRGVGASGFGVNSARDIRICDAVSKNNPSGMGFALWQSSGIALVDCVATGNGFAGFNFERVTGTVTMTRPRATGNRYDMRIANDRGSARYRIVDPHLHHGTWTVWLPKRWYGTTNRQRRSDITVIVDGKRRNDLLRIRTY